jgi:hypothetical protein
MLSILLYSCGNAQGYTPESVAAIWALACGEALD